MRATLPLLVVAACSLALAVRGVPTAAAAGLAQLLLLLPEEQQQPLQQPGDAAANATCTASGCNFYFDCDEDRHSIPDCKEGRICPGTHCGQVDAAPSMPKKLFEPQYAKELAAYIKFTQGIQIQDPFCGGYIDTPVGDPNPKLGTCASQGYKYKHANEPGRRVAWGGFPHGLSPDFGSSTVLQKACLTGCGCCMNTSVLYYPGTLPECAPGYYPGKKLPMCTECAPSGCSGVCALCAPSFNAERDIDFYFTSKVQNVCELRDGGGSDPTCSAATTPLACLAHPLKCAWRTPTATGTCISTGTVDGTGPDLGKKCCSVFSRGATCGFDCNTCRAPGVNASKYGGRTFFSQCCDQCEICLASGNGTIATEATCDKPGDGEFSCAWQKNK